MGVKEENREFHDLLQEKHHKELINSLRGIAVILNKDTKDDSEIIEAIYGQSKPVQELTAAIYKMLKEGRSEIKIETNQDAVVAALKMILEGQQRILKALSDKPIVNSFEIIKDKYSVTKSIKVNYK